VDTESTGPLVTEASDPRITKVGALLRASKLDELPQLFNVLKGDMTLIGPRPEVPHFLQWYNPDELAILRVRPGLTGPGQIAYTEVQASDKRTSGDPEQDYVNFQLHPKLSLDLDYLRRRGLWVDMSVMLMTITMFFRRSHGRANPATAARPCRCASCSWQRQMSLSNPGTPPVRGALEEG